MSSRSLVVGLVGFAALGCANVQSMMNPAPAPVVAPAPAEEVAAEAEAAPAAGGGGGNVAACKRYIEKTNAAPCMSMMKLDASTLCSDALDSMPCDVSKYFDCMAENTKCNGPVPDLSGQGSCGAPTCPM